ncbi:hypothetical protein [Acidiphilium acidophilum]|uniref:hypothetical protein n=1 Tax=Acidiphilium acidophilum TaxID=76588 RepID=UPI002E8E6BE4|nr:hypothetical protein [Acidiphilium acidophilum]
MQRYRSRRDRLIKQHGRVTDKYRLQAWWLRGMLDEVTRTGMPPLHPDLQDEYENGAWCARHGYVRITDISRFKRLIIETERGRPYQRGRFAQEHPDLLAVIEPMSGGMPFD